MGKALGILSSAANTIGGVGNIIAEFDLIGGPWAAGEDLTNHVIVAFDAVLTVCEGCAKGPPSGIGSPPTLTGVQSFDILKSSDGGMTWVDLFGVTQMAIASTQGQALSTLAVFADDPSQTTVAQGDLLRIDATLSNDGGSPPVFCTGGSDITILLKGTPI